MTNSKLVIAALAALSLTAGRAYAEGDDEGNPCGGGEETANPCGGGEAMPAPEPTAEAAADTGLAGYPQAVIDRPGVLPKGMLEVTGDVPIVRISITVLGVTASSTGVGLGLAARYGIAPKIDGQLGYGFSLKDFEIKGNLSAAFQYDVKTDDKLRVAARLTTGYSVLGSSFDGLGLGVNLQYKITPKIAVFTPGDQLTMGGSDFPKPVAINLPVGVGFQANEKINAFASTNIGTIGLSPSGNAFIGDVIPLTVGGTFSPSNKLDVGASFAADLKTVGDAFLFNIHAAMRM